MDIPDTDFEDFLQQLVDGGELEGAALGITKQVISNGEQSLSDKQSFIFQRDVIKKFAEDDCVRCGNEIPWSEKYFAIESGGLCSWCSKMEDNDKKFDSD
jgi:hypothetical protein